MIGLAAACMSLTMPNVGDPFDWEFGLGAVSMLVKADLRS